MKSKLLNRVFYGFFLLFIGGCSIDSIAVRAVSNILSGEETSTVFTSDDDPQLVADALPFTIKLHESLVAADPENTKLLLATGRLFVTYANLFIQEPASRLPGYQIDERIENMARAKKHYLRGRRYILNAIEVIYPGFNGFLDSGAVDEALALTDEDAIDYLYWLGAAWLGAFTTDTFDMHLLVTVPTAAKLLEHANSLDNEYQAGSIHEILLQYYATIPENLGGSEERALDHFSTIVKLSNNGKAGPYVSLATSISIKNQNATEFQSLLTEALSISLENENYRLQNIISQIKAKWLLDNIEEYFLEIP